MAMYSSQRDKVSKNLANPVCSLKRILYMLLVPLNLDKGCYLKLVRHWIKIRTDSSCYCNLTPVQHKIINTILKEYVSVLPHSMILSFESYPGKKEGAPPEQKRHLLVKRKITMGVSVRKTSYI